MVVGTRYSPANYRKNLQDALDIFHAELPRALVNLALIFDIAPIAQLGKTDIWCSLVHALVCACGQDASMALALRDLTHAYQNATESLIASGRYNTRDDFTVVIQPFFKNTEPPVLVRLGFISTDRLLQSSPIRN
ncbi:phospholipase B1, membrane-associated-like [Elysia marginata]|uniref:Phospholipase B1, membrane-associated-like n=1 Tax=Elysia marginata TaxID=1093978 RepID=A0AAV4JRK4_9GAST|nr:phospholipase B1, membrane-associated-like [Elysia marginata]